MPNPKTKNLRPAGLTARYSANTERKKLKYAILYAPKKHKTMNLSHKLNKAAKRLVKLNKKTQTVSHDRKEQIENRIKELVILTT